MQEQELFQSYEVKNWNFSTRIYKILAISAILNILALLIVGQTNLLTKKGCDSPLVGKVCQVIDTLYVGGTILTTKTEVGEVPYDPTAISPDDEITFINVADQLQYPEGYFAQSNPELAMIDQTGNYQSSTDMTGFTNIPGIPNPSSNPTLNGGSNLMTQPQVLPPTNPSVVTNGLPDSPLGSVNGTNPTITRYKPSKQKSNPWRNNPTISNKSPNNLPKFSKDPTSADVNVKPQPTPQTSPTPEIDNVAKQDDNGIFKNKKPLKDFASNAKEEVKTAKLDAPFTVTIAADLDYGKDGKTVVLKNPKPVKNDSQTPNDPAMAKLAQDAILAIGDSGWLAYLKNLGVKKVVFTLSQDDNFLSAKILGEQKDENTASTNSSSLNLIIQGAKAVTDGDEKILLDKANTTSEGKSLILNFKIPKEVAQEMITRKLKEAEDKKIEDKKNGSSAKLTEVNKTTTK